MEHDFLDVFYIYVKCYYTNEVGAESYSTGQTHGTVPASRNRPRLEMSSENYRMLPSPQGDTMARVSLCRREQLKEPQDTKGGGVSMEAQSHVSREPQQGHWRHWKFLEARGMQILKTARFLAKLILSPHREGLLNLSSQHPIQHAWLSTKNDQTCQRKKPECQSEQ